MATVDQVQNVPSRVAIPPPGTTFELGWVMAQLFDRPRQSTRLTPRPFNSETQLPMIPDLNPDLRLRMATAQLVGLVTFYPALGSGAAKIQEIVCASSFSAVTLSEEIQSFHLAALEELVDDPPRLSAYHLGIALSDLCWNYQHEDDIAVSFLYAFSRNALAELQVMLRAASGVLPPLAAATLSKSLEKWQDWVDVTAPMLKSDFETGVALRALRHQGNIWHALLTVPPLEDDEEGPDPARIALLRRIRFILIAGVLTAVVLYLTITNFSGSAKVWTTIGTIAAAIGVTGANLLSAARKAVNAFGWNSQTTAKAEARVWSVTLLPAIVLTARQRSQLDRRGVRVSLRKNLDVS